jgi:hypothetical protein
LLGRGIESRPLRDEMVRDAHFSSILFRERRPCKVIR